MSETERKVTETIDENEKAQIATAIQEQRPEDSSSIKVAEATVSEVAPEKKKEPPKDARSYELIFLVDAGLSREEMNALIEKVQNFLEQREGIVDNIRVSDVRKLAYEIKKRTYGVYVVFNFWLKPNLLSELERMLRLEERILRHMVIKVQS
ncbi:MAG: 30S ribosomal protein S6 [Armatimonadetes bacterium]|nr:30S ribosomal protein S6 [Armatimonadota bacterium]